jgi:hypothetical protein
LLGSDIESGAARNGNLSLFLWALEQAGLVDIPLSSICELGLDAARAGSVPILEWLSGRTASPIWDATLLEVAIREHHLHVVRWIQEHAKLILLDESWTEWICYYSAQERAFDILKWAREMNFPWDPWVPIFLANNENSKPLEWALENGCPISPAALGVIAKMGNLEYLKILRKYGATWDEDGCASAAGSGDSELLHWALENGCLGNDDTFFTAIVRETVTPENLQILKNYGIPLDTKTIGAYSVENANLEIIRWVFENGAEKTIEAFISAAERGDLEILEYIFNLGCPWDASVCASTLNIPVIRWLHERGCPWDERLAEKLAEDGAGGTQLHGP